MLLQILFKYPPGKRVAMRENDLPAFCFPEGVKVGCICYFLHVYLVPNISLFFLVSILSWCSKCCFHEEVVVKWWWPLFWILNLDFCLLPHIIFISKTLLSPNSNTSLFIFFFLFLDRWMCFFLRNSLFVCLTFCNFNWMVWTLGLPICEWCYIWFLRRVRIWDAIKMSCFCHHLSIFLSMWLCNSLPLFGHIESKCLFQATNISTALSKKLPNSLPFLRLHEKKMSRKSNKFSPILFSAPHLLQHPTPIPQENTNTQIHTQQNE